MGGCLDKKNSQSYHALSRPYTQPPALGTYGYPMFQIMKAASIDQRPETNSGTWRDKLPACHSLGPKLRHSVGLALCAVSGVFSPTMLHVICFGFFSHILCLSNSFNRRGLDGPFGLVHRPSALLKACYLLSFILTIGYLYIHHYFYLGTHRQ